MIIKPLLYKIGCSACGMLTTLPIDIIQTEIMSNKIISFEFSEIKLGLVMTFMFALQNEIHSRMYRINSKLLRGLISGTFVAPVYSYIQKARFETRLKINIQNINVLYILLTIRSILFYTILYSNLNNVNNILRVLYASIVANVATYPLKIIAFKNCYPYIYISNNQIIQTYLIEILKNILGDSVSLYLIYNSRINKLMYK